MALDWQDIAAGLLVLAAAAYLARQGWRTLRARKAGCGGGCRGCGQAPSSGEKEPHVVPLETLTRRP